MTRTIVVGLAVFIGATVLLEGLAAAWLHRCALATAATPRRRPIALDPSVGYGYDPRDYAAAAGTAGSRLYTRRRYGPSPPAGEKPLTILALGGSTTDPILQAKYAGVGGDWPHQLGERLAAAGRPVEIVNAAVVGNLAAQELVRLVAVLPESRADVVVSLGGINEIYFADRAWYRDPDNRCAPKFLLDAIDELPSGGRLHHGDVALRSTSPLHWLRGTAIERLVRDLWHGRRADDDALPTGPGTDESLRATTDLPKERRERLAEAADAWLVHERMMRAVCREFGVRHVVVLQPALGVNATREALVAAWRETVDAGAPDEVLQRTLARPGAHESLAHLYGLLRERGRTLDDFHDASLPPLLPDSGAYYHSPRYPNARGNARIAAAIQELLQAE